MAVLPCYLPVPPTGWPLCHCFIACWNAAICGHGPTSAEPNTTTSTWSPYLWVSQPLLAPTEMIFPVLFLSLCPPPQFVQCAGNTGSLPYLEEGVVSSSSRGDFAGTTLHTSALPGCSTSSTQRIRPNLSPLSSFSVFLP